MKKENEAVSKYEKSIRKLGELTNMKNNLRFTFKLLFVLLYNCLFIFMNLD